MFDLTGKAKWDAWEKKKGKISSVFNRFYNANIYYFNSGMSSDAAKEEYVKKAEEIVKIYS